MIAHIQGTLAEKFLGSVIIDVNGVGYEVQITSQDFDNLVIGENIKLYTYHHIREQSQELYGFSSLASKKLFEMLITVQGIGPKAALSILSLGSASEVQSAISRSDSSYLSGATGVGKRTAERVVVDLSDKVGAPLVQHIGKTGSVSNDEALDALMALGYSLSDGISALDNVDNNLPTSDRVTQALKNAARQ
jgi:Holliday junction DNA helicase RuvA